MSIFTNQKTWFFIALFFIVVNIVLICGFVRIGSGRHGHKELANKMHEQMMQEHKRRGASFLHAKFIADTLEFSSQQKEKLEKMEAATNKTKDSLFLKSEDYKKAFTAELYSKAPDKNKLDSLALCISSTMQAFNKVRVEKVFQVRSICTPAQLEKFSTIMSVLSAKREHGRFHQNQP